jgi:DNA end-binding protein Ku
MRDALQGKAGIGTVAFHGRERLVAIEPRDRGLIMFTLRRTDEVRNIDSIGELDEVPKKTKPEEVALAKKVMGGFDHKLDLSTYRDTYEDALRKMIDRKIAGKEVVEPTEPEAPARVVNLMDALRKSLDQVSAEKKKPARAAAPAAHGKKTAHRAAAHHARRKAS